MNRKSSFNNLLVPIDFSDASRDAFQRALDLVDCEDSFIIVLHVIDESLVDLIAENELGERDDVIAKLRSRAEQQLTEFTDVDLSGLQVDRIVSVGMPFLEIIRKSEDFAVDAIVMGMVGTGGTFEKLLFGSTAEKVLRGSKRPVIILPKSANSN